MRQITREEIIEERNRSGLGLVDSVRSLKRQAAIEAVKQATTLDELKPVLLFILGE